MKDVPVEFPEGLGLVTICEREDPRDAFVSNKFNSLDDLPEGSIVGTSSLRRQCQLAKQRPDLVIRSLRGNVGTRLSKLDNGDYDAIILAVAGLKRLGLESRVRTALPPEVSLPAVGQGAVGIECRLDDLRTRALLAPLNHEETALRVKAERAMNTRLEGAVRCLLAAMQNSSTVRFGYERWSVHLTGRRWCVESVVVHRRMPNKWAFPGGRTVRERCAHHSG